jgi:primosomal protein N'
LAEVFAQVVDDSGARWTDNLITYQVGDELLGVLQPGMLVEVPFGPRLLAGYVLELSGPPAELDPSKIRLISRLIEATPIWGEELLELAKWLSRFYQSTWQDSLQAVIPGPVLMRLRKLPKPRKQRSPMRKVKDRAEAIAHPRPVLTAAQSKAVEAARLKSTCGWPSECWPADAASSFWFRK